MAMYNPHRASVLWTKGQNFFAAFFVEIGNARKAISDDRQFADWCFKELHLAVGTLTRVADVLARVDAEKVKQEFASARAAEREARKIAHQASPTALKKELERTRQERDEARKEVERLRAELIATKEARPAATNAAEANTKNRDRHRPGYMAAYMRLRRAAQKQRD
jgi:hypothetical protein